MHAARYQRHVATRLLHVVVHLATLIRSDASHHGLIPPLCLDILSEHWEGTSIAEESPDAANHECERYKCNLSTNSLQQANLH